MHLLNLVAPKKNSDAISAVESLSFLCGVS